MKTKRHTMSLLKNGIFSAFTVALLAGCAGNPPTEQITRSSYVIKEAEEDGAAEFAPLELRNASKTLEKAQAAVKDSEYEDALNFAKTAEVEAQLAKAKTEAAKRQKSAEAVKAGMGTLKQELKRSQTDK